nr:hypothetical protein [Alcaligenes faecalis]
MFTAEVNNVLESKLLSKSEIIEALSEIVRRYFPRIADQSKIAQIVGLLLDGVSPEAVLLECQAINVECQAINDSYPDSTQEFGM